LETKKPCKNSLGGYGVQDAHTHVGTDEWCVHCTVDRDKLAEVFDQLQFVPEVDCYAARSNAVCEKFSQ